MNKLNLFAFSLAATFLLAACSYVPSPSGSSATGVPTQSVSPPITSSPTPDQSQLTDQQLLDQLQTQPTDTTDQDLDQLNQNLTQ